jgi:hypothetical protein
MDLLWRLPLLLAIIEHRGARERGSRVEVPGAHGRAGGSEVSRRRRRSNCATAFELRDDDGTARRRSNCATVMELRRRERKFFKLRSRDQFFSHFFSPNNFFRLFYPKNGIFWIFWVFFPV